MPTIRMSSTIQLNTHVSTHSFSELQLVSSGLKPPPETDLAAERLIAIRKRMMTLQKKLRTLEDVVYKISSTVEKRAAATQSTQL